MRRQLGHIAAAVVLAAFTVACAYSYTRLTRQFDAFMEYFRTGNWIATQANLEFTRLVEAIALYQAAPDPAAHEAMMTRLDVFWSRLPLIVEGTEGIKLRSMPGVVDAIQAILADLPALESKLHRLDGGDKAAFQAALREAETYRQPLQDMLRGQMFMDANHSIPAELVRQRHELLAAFSLVVLAGIGLYALLARSLRSARAASDAARVSEARAHLAHQELEDAIESLNEGFVLYDKDERLVIANAPYKSFYPTIAAMVHPGARLEEILRESARKGQYSGDYDPEAWTQTRLEQHRNPTKPIIQHLRDGRTLRISDHRTRSGGFVSVRSDVTDLMRAEDLLTKRLAAIEAAPDGIAIVGSDGRIIYANASLGTLYGLASSAMAGMPWAALFAAPDSESVPARAVAESRAAPQWRGSALGLRADATTFPMDLSLSALQDDGFVLVLRNMQHEIDLQREHTRLEHQFHQAQKMEAIGRLAGGIAHDFNNILAAIMGYASFLVEDIDPASRQAGFARNIQTAAGHAKQLVQQILAFSRSQDVERLPVDPSMIVAQTVDLLRPTLPPTTRLDADEATKKGTIWANPTQIGQVLMNLCVNANDALDGRPGTITLRIDADADLPAAFGQSARPDRDVFAGGTIVADDQDESCHVFAGGPPRHRRYARLAVADDGAGMSRRVMERMFDPFFTTKEVGKGTGLGLAAVHGIVLAHGGMIEVASRVGKGSSFHIYLPLSEQEAIDAKSDGGTALPRGTERIMVVEDQEMVGSMLATSLERLGYDVTLTASPGEALEALTEDASAWDLLLSDIRMPEIGGLDLARFARSQRKDMPIILCSGYADPMSEIQAQSLGIAAILSKPVDAAKLAKAVRAALDQSRPDRRPNSRAA